MARQADVLTLRLPCCEKRCPQEGSLHICHTQKRLVADPNPRFDLRNYGCTHKWLITCVCPDVDVQVCFLRETFAAAWEVAVVLALLA